MKATHEDCVMASAVFAPRGTRLAAAVAAAVLFAAANAREANYNELQVSPYTLEDPLSFADGRKLKDATEWPKRRKEIMEMFAREMYGRPAPALEAVVCDLVEEGATLAGLGIRRQYRMWFKGDRSGPFVDWLLVLPNQITGNSPTVIGQRGMCENKVRVPVVVMLNFRGNHAVLNDPEVPIPSGAWFRGSNYAGNSPKESERGIARDSRSRTTVPLDQIVARGYSFLTACYA